jgi:hypothetical protein
VGERSLHTREVAGSKPAAPIDFPAPAASPVAVPTTGYCQINMAPLVGNNPLVNVVSSSCRGDVTTAAVRLQEGHWSPPLAPASLWDYDAEPPRTICDLHKCVSIDGDTATFESSGEEILIGGPYTLQGWWTPDALQAVEDESLRWRERRYDGDDDFCLLTWKTLNPGDTAYRSEVGWVSSDAYDRFIRRDFLRLRSPQRGS